MDEHERLGIVEDRKSFFKFVEALISDRIEAAEKEREMPSMSYGQANDRANSTIEAFLEAALAWAEAMPDQLSETASWQSFADFLYAGKIYE